MTSYKALLSHVSHQVVSGKVFRGEGEKEESRKIERGGRAE